MTHPSKYTQEIKDIVRSMRAPYRGFVIDVIEHPSYLELRVYKPNIETFSEPQKLALSEHLYLMQQTIESAGVKCFIQGSYDDPPSRESLLSGRKPVR